MFIINQIRLFPSFLTNSLSPLLFFTPGSCLHFHNTKNLYRKLINGVLGLRLHRLLLAPSLCFQRSFGFIFWNLFRYSNQFFHSLFDSTLAFDLKVSLNHFLNVWGQTDVRDQQQGMLLPYINLYASLMGVEAILHLKNRLSLANRIYPHWSYTTHLHLLKYCTHQ